MLLIMTVAKQLTTKSSTAISRPVQV